MSRKFCGVRTRKGIAAATVCRWPGQNPEVTLLFRSAFPGMTAEATVRVVKRVCDTWTALFGIRMRPAGPGEQALIVASMQPLDGRNGVLAQSELPCGAVRQLSQQYDTGEQWNEDLAYATALHECGHAIGFDHIPASQGRAVMNPVLNLGLAPTDLDVAAGKLRYGPPVTIDPPPPTGGTITIVLDPAAKTAKLPEGWRLA